MNKALTPVDIRSITTYPDLLRLVEEVKTSKQPRILKRDSETVAVLMPVATAVKRSSQAHKHPLWTHYDPKRVRAALKKSAGALQGVDKATLLTDLATQRSQESLGPFLMYALSD